MLELVELMSSPNRKVTDAELLGRSSGSLAWRSARGEQGKTSSELEDEHVWKISEAEKASKVFHLVSSNGSFISTTAACLGSYFPSSNSIWF